MPKKKSVKKTTTTRRSRTPSLLTPEEVIEKFVELVQERFRRFGVTVAIMSTASTPSYTVHSLHGNNNRPLYPEIEMLVAPKDCSVVVTHAIRAQSGFSYPIMLSLLRGEYEVEPMSLNFRQGNKLRTAKDVQVLVEQLIECLVIPFQKARGACELCLVEVEELDAEIGRRTWDVIKCFR